MDDKVSDGQYAQYNKNDLLKEIKRLKSSIKKQKYGLVWIDKKEEFDQETKIKIPTLTEVKINEIITDLNQPTNILIEGDNYHALTCLNYTHKSKVDVIYIDPPYNTGNKTWRYNNDYIEKDDVFRHSKWLSFMHKRLVLAKNLLTDTGIIIIAIDDYELFTLGMMSDEIFLEKNRIGIIPVRNNPPGRAISNYFATNHEYYLFYAKNIDNTKIVNLPIQEDDKKKFCFKDKYSYYQRKPLSMRGHGSIEERPNNYFPIYVDLKTKKISLDKDSNSIKILPHIGKDGKQRVWDYPKESMIEFIENEDIDFDEINGKVLLYKKNRLDKGMRPKSLWLDKKYDSSAYGAVLLKNMFNNKKIFDYPKSLYAVIDAVFLSSANKKNVIVLDFFAGSGTTGHAILELNKKDGGNRQFILCTNNENNICTDVCYPRLRKVMKGYKDFKNKYIPGLGANLKYYKTQFIGKNNVKGATDEDKIELSQNAGELLALAENILYQKERNDYWQIFQDKSRFTAIYFREELNKLDSFIKKVSTLKGRTVVYVFSWGNEEFDDDFAELKDVEVKSIPQPILEIYKQINNLD